MLIASNGNWIVPCELQTFKDYITNPTNGIISADTNDIEVLYALPDTGFSYIDGYTNGVEGAEIPAHGIKGIADTPDYPATTNAYPETAFGTHSIYLRANPVSGALDLRTLLPHELLHILMREEHSSGGVNDSEVGTENLFVIGRRITTAPYLTSFGYSVSSSYENQDEKVRAGPILRDWEN